MWATAVKEHFLRDAPIWTDRCVGRGEDAGGERRALNAPGGTLQEARQERRLMPSRTGSERATRSARRPGDVYVLKLGDIQGPGKVGEHKMIQ